MVSTYSYVPAYYALRLEFNIGSIIYVIIYSVGDPVIEDWVFKSYVVTILEFNTHVDIIILDMVDSDVILRMDYLSTIMWSWIILPRLLPLPYLAYP